MRIGLDIREFVHEEMTGIGRYLLNFLEWTAREKTGVQFILYANQYSISLIDGPNFEIKVIPESVTFIWDQVLLPIHLKKDKVDVFFSPYYKAPLFSPCPVCITIHDLLFLEIYSKGLKEKTKNILFLIIAGFITRKTDKIITDSSFSRQDIQRHLKADKRKISVLSINTSGFLFPEKDQKNIERIKQKYNTGKNFILYIGNFKKHKNVEKLLDAFRVFSTEECFSDFNLVLGGKKNGEAKKIEKKIEEFYLEGRVNFTGYLPENDLQPLYSAASIFVFPSLYEGYGLPVLEAMACGTPVICSNRASLPETAGDAAILMDPENTKEMAQAMKEVAGDNKKRETLIRKGLARVEKLNEVPFAERLFNIIASLRK